MRQIKFRFWHKELEAWYGQGVPLYKVRFNIGTYDDYKVSQFTGLLDKNGVEIYEGDVVEASIYGDDEQVLPVYFCEGGFGIDFEDGDYNFYYLGNFPNKVKVIGNIYEGVKQ